MNHEPDKFPPRMPYACDPATHRTVQLLMLYPINPETALITEMLTSLVPFVTNLMFYETVGPAESDELDATLKTLEGVVRLHAKAWVEMAELEPTHNGSLLHPMPLRPPKLAWGKVSLVGEIKAQSKFLRTEIKAMKIRIGQMKQQIQTLIEVHP